MNEQVLALAGVFQASELVRQAAHHGTWSGYAAHTSLDSLFRMEADTTEAIYGGRKQLGLGLETLATILSGEQQNPESLQHAVNLLQLERRFINDKRMVDRVGTELLRIGEETAKIDEHERDEQRAEAVAVLYRETLSSVRPRIIVNGRPQHLQTPRTVNWIRSLLFAGLRSAVLWDQLGGGRFRLLIGRKRLLRDTIEILES